MRITLINPVIRPEEKPKYFPLGLGYIAASLQSDGHEVSVLDLSVEPLARDAFVSRLRGLDPDIVGLTGLITEYSQIIELSRQAREAAPDARLVLGGGLATLAPELMLSKTRADAVVWGEGEVTARRLASRLEQGGGGLDQVAGTAYLEQGVFHRQAPAELIQDLDRIPHPAWDLFPAEVYFNNMRECWLFDENLKGASILTSRGCPYSCVYCDHSMWGRRHRRRSPGSVIAELRELKDRYGIESFLVADDTFTMNKNWVLEFCRDLKSSGLGLKWACNSRVDKVDEEMVRAIKSAGCVTIAYGVETASAAMLKELNKQVTVQEIEDALRLALKAGLSIRTYMIIGSFGETRETVQESVKLLQRFRLTAGFNILTPIPGTALFEEAVRRGKINEPVEAILERWTKWQDSVIIPLTDNFTPEQLLDLKDEVTREVNDHAEGRSLPAKTLRYFRRYGTAATIRKIAGKIRRRPPA